MTDQDMPVEGFTVKTGTLPPSELAKQQLAKARAAATAGGSAWRNGAAAPAISDL